MSEWTKAVDLAVGDIARFRVPGGVCEVQVVPGGTAAARVRMRFRLADDRSDERALADQVYDALVRRGKVAGA